MSLINEALRKSTRQSPSPNDPKGAGQGQGFYSPKPPRRRFSFWIPVGLVVVVLTVFLGVQAHRTAQQGIPQTQVEEPTLPSNPTGEQGAVQQSLPATPQEISPLPEKPQVSSTQPFTLNGVVMGGDTPIALINNRVIQKGEEIDGYVLKEVMAKKVMLEKEGQTLELRLP